MVAMGATKLLLQESGPDCEDKEASEREDHGPSALLYLYMPPPSSLIFLNILLTNKQVKQKIEDIAHCKAKH